MPAPVPRLRDAGRGRVPLQPVLLDDLGEIVADAAEARGNATLDAAGPDTLTFEALVAAVGAAIGRRRRIAHVTPPIALGLLKVVSALVGEVVLSRQELDGLMEERLVSGEPPRGAGRVTEWIATHGAELGLGYASRGETALPVDAPTVDDHEAHDAHEDKRAHGGLADLDGSAPDRAGRRACCSVTGPRGLRAPSW